MKFFKVNLNPKGWKTGDCVVRAVTMALLPANRRTTWNSTYTELCQLGNKKCRMPNEPKVYEAYIKSKGFIQMKQMKHPDGTKYLVREVIEAFPNDILLIHCARHLTCAIRGNLIDTWNSGLCTAGKFYILDKTFYDEEELPDFIEYVLPYLND